jgi:hypothetical protein
MAIGFSDAVQLAGPLIAAAGLVLGVWYRVEGKVDKVRADANASAAAAHQKAEEAVKELNAFKMKVVEEYASWDTVRSIEGRLSERMDNITDAVMKMPDAVVDRIMKYLTLKPTN